MPTPVGSQPVDAHLLARGDPVGQQPLLERRVDPGAGDDARTPGVADLVVPFHEPAMILSRKQSLADRKLADRGLENGELDRFVALFDRSMRMVVPVVLRRVHLGLSPDPGQPLPGAGVALAGSSQRSENSVSKVSIATPP